MMIIAIDPGATGAIAMKCTCCESQPVCVKMPKDRKEIRELFSGIAVTSTLNHGKVVVILEQIGTVAFNDNSPATISILNRHVGHVEVSLDVAYLDFEEVHPRTWMKLIGPLPKGYADRKRAIKEAMQERWPDTKVTLWNADALGILHWAMEGKYGSNPKVL